MLIQMFATKPILDELLFARYQIRDKILFIILRIVWHRKHLKK